MTAPQPMPALTRATVQAPVRGGAAHWAYGTAVVNRPGTTEVLLTVPSAASRAPWARLDVAGGDLVAGSGMPGPLRSALPGDDPDSWWVLGLHGLGRIHADDPTVVRDVVRTGIGRYPRRLVALGPDLLAVGTDLSGNVVLVSTASGQPVGRLRLPQADLSYATSGGLVRVFAPRAGRAYDVDPAGPTVMRRHRIPVGKGAALAGGTLYYLAGEARPILVLAPGEPAQPGVPVVVGDGAGTAVGSAVVASAVVGIDAETLAPVEIGPRGVAVSENAVEVLGVDREGRLVVTTRNGFALVDPASGAVLAEHLEPSGLAGAGLVPAHDTVVLATLGEPLGTIALVSW